MTEPIYSPGLEGVVAGETAISTITDGLRYRGYLIDDLDSSIQNQFGRLPNSCYVIDTSGTVVYKESWSNPANLERVLKRLVNAKARPRRAKPPKRRRYY